jgi:hypothetical protein
VSANQNWCIHTGGQLRTQNNSRRIFRQLSVSQQRNGNIGWVKYWIHRNAQLFMSSKQQKLLLDFCHMTVREDNVDVAVKLNVLAICAVFAFVGAILLGLF